MQDDLATRELRLAYAGDGGVLRQKGFGLRHAGNGAAEHGLDGTGLHVIGRFVGVRDGDCGCALRALGRAKCMLDAIHVGDVGLVRPHPGADAVVKNVAVLADQGAAAVVAIGADFVEGEDEGVAERAGLVAEPAGCFDRKVRPLNEVGADSPEDRAVGTDQGVGLAQVQVADNAHSIGMTAARGYDDFDARVMGGLEGGAVSRAHLALAIQESAVDIDGNDAR